MPDGGSGVPGLTHRECHSPSELTVAFRRVVPVRFHPFISLHLLRVQVQSKIIS